MCLHPLPLKTGVFTLLIVLSASFSTNSQAEDCVILLHGLASNEYVMKPLEMAIDVQPELRTQNQTYNSYSDDISVLAMHIIPDALERCAQQDGEQIHFVTHSMGGLLLRAYLAEREIANLGRTVMIAPPNSGSEIVDLLDSYGWPVWLLGPAGKQLTTDEDALPRQLPSPNIDLGIIAGTKSARWLFRELLPSFDDGKVSSESTELITMQDFVEIQASHTGLLMQKETIEQTLSFLRYGKFSVHSVPQG